MSNLIDHLSLGVPDVARRRAAYPIPDVYTAFVRDPFGNKLEAIHNGFAA